MTYKFKKGDRVKWHSYGIGTVLGVSLNGEELHVRFDGYDYSNSEYEDDVANAPGNLYNNRDYHTPYPSECIFAYNGLQRAIKKAKAL